MFIQSVLMDAVECPVERLTCRVLTWRDEKTLLVVSPVAAVLEIWLRSIRRFRLSCPVEHPPELGDYQPCF